MPLPKQVRTVPSLVSKQYCRKAETIRSFSGSPPCGHFGPEGGDQRKNGPVLYDYTEITSRYSWEWPKYSSSNSLMSFRRVWICSVSVLCLQRMA